MILNWLRKRLTLQYSLTGLLLGSLFLILALVLEFSTRGNFNGWPALVELYAANRLIWVITSAPLVLAVVFLFAGQAKRSALECKSETGKLGSRTGKSAGSGI